MAAAWAWLVPGGEAGRLALLSLVTGLALAGLAGPPTGLSERIDEGLFDLQVRLIRVLRPPAPAPSAPDVVIVGIDESTLKAIEVPLAMIHVPLGAALKGIAAAGPATTALDVVLPTRSYDKLVPGLDHALVEGLATIRRAGGIVFVLDADSTGQVRPPEDTLIAAAGGVESLGAAFYPEDNDGVVRRFDPHLTPPLPPLASVIAQRLGRGERVARAGWIDYTRGTRFTYVPLIDVVRWYETGDLATLRSHFNGRVVLIGSVLPYADRLSQPINLVGWVYPEAAPPGVLIHAQLLRSVLGAGLIHPVAPAIEVLLTLALAAVAFVGAVSWRWAILILAVGASFLGAAWLQSAGWRLALGVPWMAGVAATGIRTTLDVAAARRARARLATTFGGYVSPQVLRAILGGEVDAGPGRRKMAFLFADLRGFTSWSEITPPERVLEVLNRYYASITPLIHRCGGTIDNFRGDGIMVMFGAPEPVASECDAAFESAREILAATVRLNGELAATLGGRPLEVSIGLAWGEAVFGDLGSEERKDFTALGDMVNVAARLQDLAKTIGYPVVMTAAFAERLSHVAGIDPPQALGERELRGHSPVTLAGWRPRGKPQEGLDDGVSAGR